MSMKDLQVRIVNAEQVFSSLINLNLFGKQMGGHVGARLNT